MNDTVSKETILAQAAGTPASSEATAIEQSRAIAQVQGALVVAQQRPRDQAAAMQRMRDTCAMMALAERAFFKYPRGGGTVTGRTIHLATELARCWGNIDFGIAELRRDDRKGESEMLAVSWDLETNMRVSNTFQVPHKRDKRGGPEVLTDLRDIYENNANMGARRLRECIFKVLPPWLTEEAADICAKTLQDGGGVPLVTQITNCLAVFEAIGVTREQIERKIGGSANKMTAIDVGNLRVTYGSIKRNEITKEEEFEPAHAEDITKSLKDASESADSGPTSSPTGASTTPPDSTSPPADGDGKDPFGLSSETPSPVVDGHVILLDGDGTEMGRFKEARYFFDAIRVRLPKETAPREWLETVHDGAQHFVTQDKKWLATWEGLWAAANEAADAQPSTE